jgi:hypothetical protein
VDLGSIAERAQVAWIRRQNVIAVSREADHCGVNGVGPAALSKQQACQPPQAVVDWRNFCAREQTSDWSLPAGTASPHLRDDTTARYRRPRRETLSLQQGQHITIVPLDCQKRTGVQDEH